MHLHKYNMVLLLMVAGICFLLSFFGREGTENERGSIIAHALAANWCN
jgi:hypothetical protein